MNFSDIFKKSFLEGYSSTDIGIESTLVCLAISSFIALYIFFVYRLLTRKTFYNKSFGISLAATAVIVSAIILTVQSNVVISLGMVGALSIVRFRTAIKDPMDLVFLFWSISVGIICGAGLAEIAVITSLVLTVGIFILDRIPVAKVPMILVINANDLTVEDKVMGIVEKFSKYSKVKTRNLSSGHLNMIIEVRVKEEKSLVTEIAALDGLESVSLLSHDGEVTF